MRYAVRLCRIKATAIPKGTPAMMGTIQWMEGWVVLLEGVSL
jgi:hypothetical protein